MKKLNKIMYGLLFLLLAATTSTFTSCRDETSVDPYFVASEADIELQYDGLTEKKQPGQFKMGANQDWKLVRKPDWVKLNHESGNRGRQTIYVTAEKNTTGEDREGYLEFVLANGKPEQVSVFQHRLTEKVTATGLRPNVNILGLDEEGKAPVVHISSNYSWEITVPDTCTWLHPSKTEGEPGDYDITLNIDANGTKATRKAHVTFTTGKLSYNLTVTQDAKVFTTPATIITLSKDGVNTMTGEENIFDINAVEGWTVSSKPAWATCSPMSGNAGDTRMTVTATANSTGAAREGDIILISAHGVEKVLKLKQENKLKLIPDNKPVGYVYFSEPFDWAHTFALANPTVCQDQVASVGGQNNKTTGIYGNTDCMTNFSQKLIDFNTGGHCIYVADGYLKLGRKNNQGGVTIKDNLDIEDGKKANVIVSFDIADNWDDETTIVLEISGDGTIVDGQSATLSKIFAPIKNTDSSKPWQWTRNHQVKIEGATANTKITIRSSQKGISGYYRWFLDNIKVTRTTTNN
ncbi:MAG: BACON domain-containing protein [Prevotellaceae bacterium]|nr:BACON domain-containing protein [Prevotellaceae bacterium]